MRCMKTGLRFNVPEFNDDTYHADMFYNESIGVAVIRGLGVGTSDNKPDLKLNLIPNGDAFTVLQITDSLKEQLTKYFPEVDIQTLKVIISDSRFF